MFPQVLLLVRSKINCERPDDVVGNRILNAEDVSKCLVEFFRPNGAAAGDVNKLHSDPDFVPGPLNSSTQDRVHVQGASGRERITRVALVVRPLAGLQNYKLL